MIRLNLANFLKLQKDMTEQEMSKKLGVSRSQLWRIKKKSSSVGQKFISNFKMVYPQESLDEYFFTEEVRCKDAG
jgi:transcriptional regulator with XRE-family HTH domain